MGKCQIGVLQGSFLGILFLLYINDPPRNISDKLILYKDDTTAIVKANFFQELEIKVSQTMNSLVKWLEVNGQTGNLLFTIKH